MKRILAIAAVALLSLTACGAPLPGGKLIHYCLGKDQPYSLWRDKFGNMWAGYGNTLDAPLAVDADLEEICSSKP